MRFRNQILYVVLAVFGLISASGVTVSAQNLVLASANQDGSNLCNDGVFLPLVSANGRFVVFHSRCSNVIPGVASNSRMNVYARDVQTGVTYLVNANQGNTGVSDLEALTQS